MNKPSISPILRYPGSKWQLATKIVSCLPKHSLYLEPYCGSAAVFLNKTPADHEIINDINGNVVNLFRVIRTRSNELLDLLELTPWARDEYDASYEPCDDELESTRRFLVRCWQAHGTRTSGKTGWRHRGPSSSSATTSLWKQLPDRLRATLVRLRDAEIENKPALEIIQSYPLSCMYVDPPYLLSTRTGPLYADEMDIQDHINLLTLLNRHKGPVIVSGYDHPLYNEMLPGWQRISMKALAENGLVRTEVLWLNAKASTQQLSFDQLAELESDGMAS